MTIRNENLAMGGDFGDAHWSHLSDEEYLMERSRQIRSTDPVEAKCWIITAKTMFPRNMAIRYEAYTLEKDEKRWSQAAQSLMELMSNSQDKEIADKLQEEINTMVAILSSDSLESFLGDAQATALLQIYKHLPVETQENLILESASNATDFISSTRQYLLALERFPNLIPMHGLNFLKTTVDLCKKTQVVTDVDPLLHRLVMEICPKLLSHTQLKTDASVLDDILRLTIQYCCSHLSSFISKAQSGSATAPSTFDCQWKSIFGYVEEIGLRLGWSSLEDLREMSSETLWQRIQSKQTSIVTQPDRRQRSKELFFLTMINFVRSLGEFMDTCSYGGDVVLVEAFVTHNADSASNISSSLKRRRTVEDDVPIITHAGEEESKGRLTGAFLRAFRHFDLIRSDPFLDERFQGFRTYTHLFSSFFIDAALYQGNFREALQLLNSLHVHKTQLEKCKHYIKMATIQFCISNHGTAADYLIQAVSLLPPSEGDSNASKPSSKGKHLKQVTGTKSRHVHFLPMTRSHLLAYCCTVLVYVMKDRCLQPASKLSMDSDTAMGHVIVLLQYIFPEESDLFHLLIHRIRLKDNFSYPSFCNYVIHVDFLEEFSHLVADVKCKLALDITPSVTNQRRMGTRGANRGEKEEIKSALKKQVARSNDNLDDIIIDFLKKYKDTILTCLM